MPQSKIAYFSMEVGLEQGMHTYSGGLGVLAGDTLRAAADAELPLVAVTLLHRNGYFRQRLDEAGAQTNEADPWKLEDYLERIDANVEVQVQGESAALRCWRRNLEGVSGHVVPVYFLDADVDGNDDALRRLTDHLYGGDERYRLSQEVLLGIGGVRLLDALGYDTIETYHMNEGHSALLTLELMETTARRAGRDEPSPKDVAAVRDRCVFTTHTPVAAGHDRFSSAVVEAVLGADAWQRLRSLFDSNEMAVLNMTELALRHSRYVNGVARKHGDVTRDMFDGYEIYSITNGVHAVTWTSAPFQALFDRRVPGWRDDNPSLRYLTHVPLSEVAAAHDEAKRALIDHLDRTVGTKLDPSRFTIGFARRATAYKRADLLLRDIDRLNRIADEAGAFQILYAGKAHPRDNRGQEIIRNIVSARSRLSDKIELVYLENYGIELGGLLTSGCDVWLNTPERPKEASGTSGMKAALNGVPSFSVLDGWWIEGHFEGVTGWSIGDGVEDVSDLYEKLEKTILPLYYDDPDAFTTIRRQAIALNGSFFNTERMVGEYARHAYRID